ncbi:LptA/OstA family protein [Chrysiogenes arsenatis]|uniref:LptA/OstA family protein n=1 Tax=Chrysiogenes arsenatis TaxID=309797 RepID=UPI00041CA9C1|nr:LptA/OstA family protein [Chrysiogenes arsenatis]
MKRNILAALLVGLSCLAFVFPTHLMAQGAHTIEADEVRAHLESGDSVFRGNVVVVAPEYTIHAHELVVRFATAGKQRSIQKMEASGDVRLAYGDKQGFGERLEYNAATATFVLQNNARLVDAQGTIAAPMIRVNQQTQEIHIESTPTQRVRLTFEGQR